MRDHRCLQAWQEARAVTLHVLRLSRTAWRPHASALFSQLQRSSLSVQLNIAEGYTFGNSPSYTRHLGIAYGSAVESGELIELAMEAEILDPETCGTLLNHSRSSQRLLLALLKKRRKLP
jgi:four helix bundle protein